MSEGEDKGRRAGDPMDMGQKMREQVGTHGHPTPPTIWKPGAFLLSTATLLGVLGLSSATWAQPQGGTYYGPHMWGGGWWMFLGPLMMIAFIAAIVVVVVLAVRWLVGSGHGPTQPPARGRTPLDILQERFARGEIDREEFEERRRVLGE